MTVKQISVFIENKSGTLLKVLELFKQANIQLIATTVSDTSEYGIYRIICSDPALAMQTLQSAGITASVSEVFTIALDDKPGRAADAIRNLTDAGISISYLYSFLLDGKGILVFRTDKPELTAEVINKLNIEGID